MNTPTKTSKKKVEYRVEKITSDDADSFVESEESNEYQPDSLDGSPSRNGSHRNFSKMIDKESQQTVKSSDMRSTLNGR